ncbi:DNA binding ATP binding nucleic acid bindin isoform 1 [Tripterygium wilfordii]|uniref:DNA binding ATP binding nucleic acid bindin isoform 1 n=1 Tax=Tripterygium wilfordii TaxID=458696 RepID=A0A7J7BVQ2_TRIWF|nr:TATA-binding protein-associated factor BTAF1 [Tripterygium wilfordii]XP_038695347.1 TATA-binding protein-associated factor BTAF1 [Tripterygium wilfordii]KAF5725765.1 DNA binding ATP binding nucleic acid bindin isoform 1 [Tripterygium wilfordii]
MAQQQSSRLNRLLTLLDTGSTQATRFTAARQIGDIAKSHPQDLNSILKKVSQYLRSKNWDTRVAAAHAIGAVAQNVKHTSLSEIFASIESQISEVGVSGSVEDVVAWPDSHTKTVSNLTFRSFDVNKVLEFGALLASGGQEYDIVTENSKNPRERLARQKQNLRRRLGLDVCEQFMDVNDMIKDEDLILQKFHSEGNGMENRFYMPPSAHHINQFVARMVPSVVSRRPSARELNLLKRKAKINSKDQTKGWSEDGGTEVSNAHNVTTPKGSGPDSLSSIKVDFDEDSYAHDGDGQWPFHSFVEQLILDMFDPVWEVRHGSVMALREILTYQGASAGVFMPDLSSEFSLYFESKDKDYSATTKRNREIDLNMQVPGDVSEPNLKRPKFQDLSCPPMNMMVSSSNSANINVCVKIEDIECTLSTGHVNGHPDVSSVKVDPEAYLDGVSCQSKEAIDFVESKGSSGNSEILRTLPCELMNLAKLARHSWTKNSEFLQDCAIRFLCVLCLDRFGDYVSDQVIAPVRETCAQALGAVFKYMHPSLVHETLNILLKMQRRPEWEIRHGSLLGIKYLVAVRQEMLPDLLGCVLPACKAGLEDPDDDVRAVAADALVPTAGAIVALRGQTLHSIVMLLWDILLDLDDLSPSTSSVMNLLAEIYSQEDMIPKRSEASASGDKQEFDLNEVVNVDDVGEERDSQENPYMLSTLAPRLWPFMRHSITSVRYSAIRTLERLLEAGHKRNISEIQGSSFWPSFILGDTLRIVFQNLLLESNEEILHCSETVWRLLVQCEVEDLEAAARSYLSSWIELTSTPFGSPLDASKMFWPVAPPRKSHFRAAAKMRAVMLENDGRDVGLESVKITIPPERFGDTSANSVKIIVGADADISVTNTRVVTASALGIFASKLREESMQYVIEPLQNALTSLSGVQRQVAAMVLISWFKEFKTVGLHNLMHSFPNHIKVVLLDLLACSDPAFPTKESLLPYAELSRTYAKMRNEASQLLHVVESSGLFEKILSTIKSDLESWTADDAIDFASKLLPICSDTIGKESLEMHITDEIESLKQRLLATSGYLKCVQSNLHVTVTALVAAAVVWMSELPTRLNPIILPLMASIKREQEQVLQQKAAEALAELIFHCTTRKPGPNDKLIKNICSLTCLDPCETPLAAVISSMENIDDQDFLSFGSSSGKQKSRVNMLAGGEDRSKLEGFISRRGSELALKHLCKNVGPLLFDKLPKLWDCLTEILKPIPADEKQITLAIESVKDPQILINNIQVVRSIAPLLDESLQPKLLTLLPCIFKCVRHNHVAVRLAASRCTTSMAKSMTTNVMSAVIENAIPMLGDMTSVQVRQGAGMLISLLVHGLGAELVPYAPLLVVPLLKCMSDSDHSVRQSVTHSFAALVPLLPLARGLPLPSGLSEDLSRNAEDAKFLEQLLDNSHIDDYKLCTELRVTLRRYQQEGINWLGFLKRFKLHGILCDDMGLGKTLQASAIVASDIAEHHAVNNSEDMQSSLIVCPSTLVGHWVFEIEKYIDTSLVSTLQYVGSALERISLREHFDKYNVIITSYDVIRKDIDYLGKILWNYCILDEGHVIKNAKSKITVAVKQLKSVNRLILSGTPIQNNVMDLWSLFDFLMPGFLGTERQFHATYGKPLLAARDPKCSAKDAEAGALAMEALHKQVMPFLLRRTKDEVLSDLPEKIIQDRYCDLSPVQLELYEKFSGSHMRQEISSMVKVDESAGAEGNNSSPKASSHVFQALKYLLKLCSHPLLVFGEKTRESLASQISELFPSVSDIISELHKLHHSPKLVALQEILQECGIGVDASSSEGAVSVGQHRVLIFAQHKAFLDIIERDLFHSHMKNITYLRLDGSVEPEKRFEIVKTFNSDPTIDALLLTTHVGGLGLNLTSADTLVFMEHDWNPMRDLQAMDRAHRLGQRKVVNVHRLIMRGTLEEKVMGLQKFKVSVANAVINAENASLKTMNTDQLLDLFASAETSRMGGTVSKRSDRELDGDPKLMGTGKGLKAILGGLEDLWDQSQYTEEYNLDNFLGKLNV